MVKLKTGIWIDTRQANIVSLNDDQSSLETLFSEIEEYHPKGGSRSNVPYGPVDTVSESQYSKRRSLQENKYFDEIINRVKEVGEVMIFGPAEIKDRLAKRINEQTALPLKVLACLTADSMTENQKVAFVSKYFS